VGSVLHAHAADPGLPVQLSRALGQPAGCPYAQQPLLPFVQVATPPETHAVWPCWQVSVHVSEQAAAGAAPAHDSGEGQVAVAET